MKTRKIVHDILRDYPETRNSDERLLIIYLIEYSGVQNNNTISFIRENFDFIRNFIRERAYWQNTRGMFLPTEGVQKARRKREAKIVEAIREEKKSFASNIYNYAKRIIRNK